MGLPIVDPTTEPGFDGAIDSTIPILVPVITCDGAALWALARDWDIHAGNWSFSVPKGSLSNFASVPFFLRVFLSPVDPAIAIPSIAHDYLVNEWPKTIYDHDTGHVVTVAAQDIPWGDAAKIFISFGHLYTGKWAIAKSYVVYGAICAYGFLVGKYRK